MYIKQFYLGCLAHASYIIIDESTHTAVVIDPQRDIDQYLAEADAHGATIKHVILTHFHADFIAGHLELRDHVGARIHLGRRASAEYDFSPLSDGDTLEFGDTRLLIMETPGHTPEGISIVAFDASQADAAPQAVFTGDTLFVGDVGRPDLLASIGFTAEDLASWLYDSLHDKLMSLPDETLVYPAHGAGSMCGKNLGSETFTTIGEQRRGNYALQPMTKDEFRAIVTSEQRPAPAYFLHDAVLNTKERATLTEALEKGLNSLSLTGALELQKGGAVIVDTRGSADFSGAHIAGSINIALDGRYATWAGTVIAPDTPIVLVAEPGDQREAALRLGRIGFDDVRGFVEGGMNALDHHEDLLASLDRITAVDLAARLAVDDAPLVLDVREPGEWDDGHLDGSIHIPLGELTERLAEVPRDRELAVICKSGYRSSLGASVLLRGGITTVANIIGGIEAWRAGDLPTTEPVATSCSS